MSAIRCCEMIYRHQCSKSGKIERDGKWYCGTHDPVRIKEKREERGRKWSERFRAQREDGEQRERDEAEQKRRADLFTELLSALDGILEYGFSVGDVEYYRKGISVNTDRGKAYSQAMDVIAKARGPK